MTIPISPRWLGLTLSTLLLAPSSLAAEVNLSYLNSLLTPITIDGKAYTGMAIYADPDPKNPGQFIHKEAPGEGLVDLDDIARAVVVYARDGSPESLKHARELLDITLLLQAPDGEFYNFINKDGSINKDGQTSFKSAGFWAARAVWGIAEALPAFEKSDPAYAKRLQDALNLTIKAFAKNVDAKYGQYRTLEGLKVPAWLPMDGTDVGSILVVGLVPYIQAHPQDAAARDLALKVTEGIGQFAPGNATTYPFGLPLPNTRSPVEWHAWGARQVQALALAGKVLNKPEFIETARKAAAHPLLQLLVSSGPIEKMTPAPVLYPQIGYGMESIASSYFALADATGEDVWNELGGLTTAWLYGLNDQRLPMYDPATGRTYDGLERGFINGSAGAESNITALLALQQAEKRPSAAAYLKAQEVERKADVLLEAEKGDDFGSPPTTRTFADASGRTVAILKDGASINLKAPAGKYSAQLLAVGRPSNAILRLDSGGQSKTVTLSAESEGLRAYSLGTLNFAANAPIALTQSGGTEALPDALWLFPELESKQVAAGTTRTLLLKSWSDGAQKPANLPAGAKIRMYDASGRSVQGEQIPAYGFALAQWQAEAYTGPAGAEAKQVKLEAAQTSGTFQFINLSPVLNTDAFSTASEPRRGNLDNPGGAAGATLPAERAPKAGELKAGNVAYLFPDVLTRPNVYTPAGEQLNLPPGLAKAVHLLITADHGPVQATAKLHFSEGEPVSVPLRVSDWCQSPQFGETVAVPFNARRISNGTLESLNCSLYSVSLAVPAGKTLTGISLPNRATLHLFALSVER